MQSLLRLCFAFVVGLFLTFIPTVVDSFLRPVEAQSVGLADTTQVQQQVQQALLDSLQPTSLGPPSTWSKSVDRVQVQGNYAVAHWTWGQDSGGWALLRNANGGWSVLTRQSDAITPQVVAGFGVPIAVAEALVNAYDPNWNTYSSP